MARKRKPTEKPSYEGKPESPATSAMAERLKLVRAVIAKEISISEAARQAGMSRVNMQTLVHRAERALMEALAPRQTGPTPRPARERELKDQAEALRGRVTMLEAQLQAADEMMGAAGEIIRHLRGLPPKRTSSARSKRSSASSTPLKAKTPSEPDPEPDPAPTTSSSRIAAALARMTTMPDLGRRMSASLGLGARTLKRWLGRLARGQPLWQHRGGSRATIAPALEASTRELVRKLGGLVGAASLAHSFSGLSRRAAAEIKQDELRKIECERQAAAARVEVTVPGVVRGFDAMHLRNRFALIASDARAPYRTSAAPVPAYTGVHVATVLAADFEHHGAPLVLRLDRARCHTTEAVLSVLERFGVLLLHGPAYHPCYYGQLERQNREHRAWLAGAAYAGASLEEQLERMRAALNRLWRRPTLDWLTAEEVWLSRPPLHENRVAFRNEVTKRAARLTRHAVPTHLIHRLAIEQALTDRGYLRVSRGGECYVD